MNDVTVLAVRLMERRDTKVCFAIKNITPIVRYVGAILEINAHRSNALEQLTDYTCVIS